MGIHGGLEETSLMLHLRPDLVDLAAGSRNVPERLAANRHVRFGGTVSFGWLSNDFGPSAAASATRPALRPSGASPVRGAVHAFGEALAEVASFDFGRSPN